MDNLQRRSLASAAWRYNKMAGEVEVNAGRIRSEVSGTTCSADAVVALCGQLERLALVVQQMSGMIAWAIEPDQEPRPDKK